MVASNSTLEEGENKLEAIKKKLQEAKDRLKTVNIELETTKELVVIKDRGLLEFEEQLAAANEVIAGHEDTIRQLTEALNLRDSIGNSVEGSGVATEIMDDRKVERVKTLAQNILELCGGK